MAGSFFVVIPARFGSSRLSGKPLHPIAGMPMVLHVLRRAQQAGAAQVWVATDDARIARIVQEAGGQAAMTSPDHASGTDRLAEVAEQLDWAADAIVVNVQGDEPLVPPALIRSLAESLDNHRDADIATVATPVRDAEELFRPQVVKVVLDDRSRAMYFSRAPIPWARDAFATMSSPPAELSLSVPFLRHVGLYAYRVSTLRALSSTPPSALERAESLEQLRALQASMSIHVHQTPHPPPHGVDTLADAEHVEQILAQNSDSKGEKGR